MTIEPVWADPLQHLPDQLVCELLLATVPVHGQLDRGGDVTPRRLAVDPDSPGDRPFTVTTQPAPQRLSDLDHRNLPERHRASSTETQPNDSPADEGGPSGGPMTGNRGGPIPLAKPAATWSHAVVKRQAEKWRPDHCRAG